MEIPPSNIGLGLLTSTYLCQCAVWVFRRSYKVIQRIIRAVLAHKLYGLCLTPLVTLVVLSWGHPLSDYNLHELAMIPQNCFAVNSKAVDSPSEIWKADAAAASTLLTLLPALLIFAPFPTARISSLIVFSTSTALVTAGYTLGLSVSNVMTLPKNKIFRVCDLCTEATIRYYSCILEPGRTLQQLYLPGPSLVPLSHHGSGDAGMRIGRSLVPELPLSIAGVSLQPRNDNGLRTIMLKALIERKRPTRMRMSVLIFGSFLSQVSLLYILVLYIPTLIEINIIWLCPGVGNYFVVWWIGITWISAGIVRTCAESLRFSHVEILHLRPLAPAFVFQPCENCVSPATTSAPRGAAPTAVRGRLGHGGAVSEYLACVLSLRRRLWTAQRSHHSMVVVLRPAEVVDTDQLDNKKLVHGVLRGFFQALLLIFLTVLFGSTYRSNIMLSSIFLTCFITVMVASRTYSIYFCAWLERATDAVQIEFATPAELRAIRTILAGMPGVLVHNTTRGCKHAAGLRLTPRRGCAEHTWSIAEPLPRMLGTASAAIAGLAVLAATVVFLAVAVAPADAEGYYFRVTGIAFFGLVGGFVVGLVAEKVYADFEFVDAVADGVGVGSSSGVVGV